MDEKIKVTDKRMFTAEGELRDGIEDEQTTSAAADETAESEPAVEPVAAPDAAQPESSTPAPAEPMSEPMSEPMPGGRTEPAASLPAPTFVDLVGLLAQPIAMFLGDAVMPGGEAEENLPLARFHIDLLELIQVKTRGNISPEEAQLLKDLLYQLRLRYVEKAG